jgi:hypothetical protein
MKMKKIYCKVIKTFTNNIVNKETYKFNKNFASKFRESIQFKNLYDLNLLNLINSIFLIKKELDTIVFMGNNPDLFLEKLPKSNLINLYLRY